MAAANQEESRTTAVLSCSYQDWRYLHGFLGTVGYLQKAGVLQDVVLEVEGRRFPCHRLVLSAASPYFRAMFTIDMAESRQKTVVLQVASSDEFCSLSVNQLTEIISHDELDVKEETTVWEAVVRWVQHSREDRLHHLPSIVPHIRFNLLTSDDTAAILEHPLVREDSGISELIRNVVQKGNPDEKPRHGMFMEMAILSNKDSDEFLFMNPHEGKYISCRYEPGDRPEIQALTVTSDNDIYILANDLEESRKLSLFRYSHVRNVWEHAGISPVSRWRRWENDMVEERLVEVDRTLYYLVENLEENVVRMRKYIRHRDMWLECSQLELDYCTYIDSAALSCNSHFYFITNHYSFL